MSDTNFEPYNPQNNQYPAPNVGLNDDLPPPQVYQIGKSEPQNAVQFLSQDNLSSKARLQFIIKVYLILLVCLALTIGVCVFSYYYKPFYNFQITYWWVALIFLGIVVALSIVIQCTSCGRRHPQNMIFLMAFVLCFSYILSYTTTYYANTYGGQIVIEACAITMAIVIALTVYAFFTRTDFTTWVGIVIVVVICFAFFGVSVAIRWNQTLNSLYCALGAILAGILLIIDTQMIVGGERSFQISMDDYVLGALVLYVDIIRLFLYILRAMGKKK